MARRLICPNCKKSHRVADTTREYRCSCRTIIEVTNPAPKTQEVASQGFSLLAFFGVATTVASVLCVLVGGFCFLVTITEPDNANVTRMGSIGIISTGLGGWMLGLMSQALVHIARRV